MAANATVASIVSDSFNSYSSSSFFDSGCGLLSASFTYHFSMPEYSRAPVAAPSPAPALSDAVPTIAAPP